MTRPAVGPLVLLVLGLTGCGGEDPDALRPVVEEIPPAIAAVEAARGGPQQYFEINASAQFVNLFVADAAAGTAIAYLYAGGELQPPAPPKEASGPTFEAGRIAPDLPAVLAQVDEDLPESDIAVFALSGTEAGGVEYSVSTGGVGGGVLDIVLSPDGDVVSVDPGSN